MTSDKQQPPERIWIDAAGVRSAKRTGVGSFYIEQNDTAGSRDIPYARVHQVDDARVEAIRKRAEIDGYRKLTLRDGGTSLALVQARADVMELLALLHPVSSSELSDDADSLHFAICQAVALMNQGDLHGGHDLLRQTLVDFADKKAPLSRSEMVRKQQHSGGGEVVTAVMASSSEPRLKDGGAEAKARELEPFCEHKKECRSNERYPSPPCDCGLVDALTAAPTESSERRCGKCGLLKSESVAWHEAIPFGNISRTLDCCKCVFPATGADKGEPPTAAVAAESRCEHGVLQSMECLNCTEEYVAVNPSEHIAHRVATEILDAIWMGSIPLTCENGDAALEGLTAIISRYFPTEADTK